MPWKSEVVMKLEEYIKAVMEGRWSTADFLYPDLPKADCRSYVHVPEDKRDRFSVVGILGRGAEG